MARSTRSANDPTKPAKNCGPVATTANWLPTTKPSSKPFTKPNTIAGTWPTRSANAKAGNAKTPRKPTRRRPRLRTETVHERKRYRTQAKEHATILADLQAKLEPADAEVANIEERLSQIEEQLLEP